MSTTFEVYPATHELPTFAALIDATLPRLHKRLARNGIDARPQIDVRIQKNRNHKHVAFDLSDPCKWPGTTYAWFEIAGVSGGTDAYFEPIDELTNDVWDDYLKDDQFRPYADHAKKCLAIGHCWSFRRSMGQPAIINLMHGLLAGCLAQLTNGLIMSDDSAWDRSLMPATGPEFLDFYFVTHRTTDADCKEWAARCMNAIAGEIAG